MKINNFELIKNFLTFESDDDFYTVQVLYRKKDSKNIKGTNNSDRTIKLYCCRNKEYLDRKIDEIILLCDIFNARAYINLSPKSKQKTMDFMNLEIAHKKMSNNFNKIDSIYEHCVMTKENKGRINYYVIDCDSEEDYNNSLEILNKDDVRPKGEKIVLKIPTYQGYHLLCRKFDIKSFTKHNNSIKVIENSLVLLYGPEKQI